MAIRYTTLAAVKAALGITDVTDDAAITSSIEAAEASIDDFAERTFAVANAQGSRLLDAIMGLVELPDLRTAAPTVELVDAEGVATAAGDVELRPRSSVWLVRPFTSMRLIDNPRYTGTVRIVGPADYGWAAVPETIIHAATLQATRLFTRRHAPFGVAGSAELTGDLRILAKLDPDVEVLVRPLRNWWAVA